MKNSTDFHTLHHSQTHFVMKTTYDIKISQILLFKIVEFTHFNFFHESPYCLITTHLKWDFRKLFYHAVLQFVLKLQESIKVTFFNSNDELIKQFISINLVEISSKRVKFWGAFVSSHIIVITATWHTNKVFKASNHSNIPEDNKQTFSANRPCSGCRRHLSKLVVSCRNEKVGKK